MIKYPEEIKQAEMLKNLERLEAKLKRREAQIKLLKEKGGDVLNGDSYRRDEMNKQLFGEEDTK